jgi:hypothetical protein
MIVRAPCALTLISGLVLQNQVGCHDWWCLRRIPQHWLCCGKLSMGVPPSLRLGLGRSSYRRRRRPHSHWRRLFSYATFAGWSRHARRYDFDSALAEQGLVPSRAATSWPKEYTQPPQIPASAARSSHSAAWLLRAAASALRRGFCAGSTARGSLHHAAWLPARSCLRRAAHSSTARSPPPVSESIGRAAHH